jgi:SAM-dependent methyltransferase
MAGLRDSDRFTRMVGRARLRALAGAAPGDLNPGSEGHRRPAEPARPSTFESPPEASLQPGAAARFAREMGPSWLASEHFAASRRLYERLDTSDVEEIERRIEGEPELSAQYRAIPDPDTRHQVLLAYGIWLGVAAVPAKTGLPAEQSPPDVHSMARGPAAAAGGLYEADLVANAMATVGVDISRVKRALDFGCSSGRVLRVLNAAYPDTDWVGCDPNGRAIEWAGEHVPGIEFFVSADHPPLQLGDDSLDLAYAISIWSHFAPELGLRWLAEMHRVISAGGHLVITTHGLTSVALFTQHHHRTPQQADEILGALYRRGWWYAPEFGEEGDWGVVNPEWGTAFLSPEWLLTQLCPRWRVLEFAPGRNQGNQDVYVLQRV